MVVDRCLRVEPHFLGVDGVGRGVINVKMGMPEILLEEHHPRRFAMHGPAENHLIALLLKRDRVIEKHEMTHLVHIDKNGVGVLPTSLDGSALHDGGHIKRRADVTRGKLPLQVCGEIAVPFVGIKHIDTGTVLLEIALLTQGRGVCRDTG